MAGGIGAPPAWRNGQPLAAQKAFIANRYVQFDGPPVLCVIIDAEEDFHWSRPMTIRHRGTTSIDAQSRTQEIFDHYKLKPTYLVTYPVACDPKASGALKEYLYDGRCEVGAQLHAWVTPPFGRDHGDVYSFQANLPRHIEQEKIHRLVGAIQDGFQVTPKVYKAGRYGFGVNTAALLAKEGFLVDTSLIPRTSYATQGGPSYLENDYRPFWFGNGDAMLELPVTRALLGTLSERFSKIYAISQHPRLRAAHVPGLLARTNLIERVTLSPEGSSLPDMIRLTNALLARGERIFTFSYHSPSLVPGNTPYVQNADDLARFLDNVSGYLHYFRHELGGTFLSARDLHRNLIEGRRPPVAGPDPRARIAAGGEHKCLVVASTFPPIHGGSAVVYDSLARFGRGQVAVLAPSMDYRDGRPIALWRENDRAAPYEIFRHTLLRSRLYADMPTIAQKILRGLSDLKIRVTLLRVLLSLRREKRFRTICIGELVANGWLASVAPALLGTQTIIYVHGEELTTRSEYDVAGTRRRKALVAADIVACVSKFTRTILVENFTLERKKIVLISNGVDIGRFQAVTIPPGFIECATRERRRVLLTVSRLHARKGIDRVIESLPQVIRLCPDLLYIIVGQGAYRPVLERLVEYHRLSRHVLFVGGVDDQALRRYYSQAQAFAMPNREMPDGETEGFGLVFLEANACGVPLVAGCAGGSTDAVSPGLNGLVVGSTSTNELAVSLTRIIRSRFVRYKLARGGYRMAANAAWQEKVGQFLNLPMPGHTPADGSARVQG